ncbi:hook-length control protein FliK [Colwellia chukchiensis]|uniref:Hook-length control protein FliK n=1 Tax=Colwellia chukchiensis TaxID=641665 RepID=A0A1H7HHH4_9GAMM|nr:flagellar hook-length control protein FliK [Colwellia chukchiensis]SEK48902.1 hook-length control protein FliK [Colwellia chukchiensis]
MPELKVLSIDIATSSDSKAAQGQAVIKNQIRGQAFSAEMAQHYPNNTAAAQPENNQEHGNNGSAAANQPPLLIKAVSIVKAGDEHTLPVPISPEQALASANMDSTMSAGVATKAVSESPRSQSEPTQPKTKPNLEIPLKAHIKGEDSHILPVPLPIDKVELSATILNKPTDIQSRNQGPLAKVQQQEKSTTKADEKTLPVPMTPLKAAQQSAALDKVSYQADVKIAAEPKLVENSSSHTLSAQTPNTSRGINNAVNAKDLLTMLSGSKELLSSESKVSNGHVGATALTRDSAQTEQTTQKVAVEKQTLTNTNVQASNAEGSSKKLATASTDVGKGFSQTTSSIKPEAGPSKANAKAVINTQLDSIQPSNIKVANKAVNIATISDNKKSLAEPTETATITRRATHELLPSDDAELQQSHAGKDSRETNAINTATTQVDSKLNQESGLVTSAAEGKQRQVMAATLGATTQAEPGTDTKQARIINQSTASLVAASDGDAKPAAQAKAVAHEAREQVNSRELTLEPVIKAEQEKPQASAEKLSASFNQTLAAQAMKQTSAAAEIMTQQEHNITATASKLTTNAVHSAKPMTAVNAETIAVYRKDFANALKDKVMVMINQKVQQVDIQLDPPELGNVHVRVNLQQEQAAVQFIVQNPQAKEALEQHLGRLRDMLAQSGVDVGDTNIEQRAANEQNSDHGGSQAQQRGDGQSGEDIGEESADVAINLYQASSTGVDYYA